MSDTVTDSLFKADPSHIADFTGKSAAQIFNEAILPTVNRYTEAAVAGAERMQQDYAALFGTPSTPPITTPDQSSRPGANFAEVNYNAPIRSEIKLSNYGYAGDTTPDYNSNVLKIGNRNNPLIAGESAALSSSLAKQYGLKPGDWFEAVSSDGTIHRRRYDDTVPSIFKGKALPPTVDLYNPKGSNNFGGQIVQIRPIASPNNS